VNKLILHPGVGVGSKVAPWFLIAGQVVELQAFLLGGSASFGTSCFIGHGRPTTTNEILAYPSTQVLDYSVGFSSIQYHDNNKKWCQMAFLSLQ
jgi:hypothetical protein